MFFNNVAIMGLSAIDAPVRMTTAEIDRHLEPVYGRLGLQAGVLEQLTGIVARRLWDADTSLSEVGARAVELALADAGVDKSEVGLLINTSVSKEWLEPSTASMIAGKAGLGPRCMNFDIANACLGFVNGMQVAGNMIQRDQIKYAVIVNGESSRQPIERTIDRLNDPNATAADYKNNLATFTLGSGATAMVLTSCEIAPDKPKLTGGVSLAATQHHDLCFGNMERMVTNTTQLLHAGLDLASRTWNEAQRMLDWNTDDLSQYVIHQVSKVHTESVAQLLGFVDEKMHRLYPEYGNVGPANIPIILSKLRENKVIKQGDRIALIGIGSGLNCAMMEVVW